MDIIGPTPVQLYNVHPTTPTQGVQDAVQHNLLLHQMIQATVVESSGRQILLEMGQQQLKAQSDVEMHNGQKLNLEVVATEPRLKLQVVSPSTDNQLLRLIHLYDHKTEIGSTLKTLLGQRFSVAQRGGGQTPVPQQGPVATAANGTTVLAQNAPPPSPVTTQLPAAPPGSAASPIPNPGAGSEAVQTPLATKPVVSQTGQTLPTAGGELPGAGADAKGIVPPSSTTASSAGQSQVSSETGAATKTSQTPQAEIPQPVVGEKATVRSVVTSQSSPASATTTGEMRPANESLAPALAPPSAQQVAGMTTLLHRLDSSSNVANALFTAINLVPLSAQQKRAVEGALTPEQWTHLETLTKDLGSDFKSAGARILFNLSHNLGLDYEQLLSQQKSDQAAQTLKGALMTLAEHDDLPDIVRDSSRQMVQQLDVLQLTRVRFAQEGILFLPLPFEFMEQGYALVEQRQGGSDGEEVSHVVTLNMSLEGLGAVQANLLFEQQALFVRILCEDDESQAALEKSLAELEEALAPFAVRSIQVAQGVEDPAVELINRLQPHHDNVFDARV
ncbi:flagellar hook-length control protein FliK [Desulfuromonas acetoxidans]|nr:flagellar hook-length control protein FliK [Desulfuromonas acetoxidans]MBF0644948.1 flagellar hook-length control protein FliK [Desulfuromonas acetoxidans]NVD25605.1 flagellar hook-length control protein FliK [Desulfuromonas acetoxidans]NVE17657.1 flagellar hook-length control protein FliK [Desulfuromonas acetoxidans]